MWLIERCRLCYEKASNFLVNPIWFQVSQDDLLGRADGYQTSTFRLSTSLKCPSRVIEDFIGLREFIFDGHFVFE